MSRPKKPDLNAEEWEAISGLGNMEAAGQVSLMRGAGLGSITQAEARRRRVSHDWILIQRRKTQPTKNLDVNPKRAPTKNQFRVDGTGARMGYDVPTEPSDNRVQFPNAPVVGEIRSAQKQVESERFPRQPSDYDNAPGAKA